MCTAITYRTKDHYFGRNLDLHYHYREAVTVTPRNYPFRFRCGAKLDRHYALIGMATVEGGYPLYYEATNEKGLSLAGLNFPGNAVYCPRSETLDNIAPFELIPWLLGQCVTVEEALEKVAKLNLWDMPFSERFPLSPLHFLLADRDRAVVLEPLAEGLKVSENPLGVLTNNPPFDFHMHYLTHFMELSPRQPENRLSSRLALEPYSFGMGAMGLPGDLSSASRFVKAGFTKMNAVSEATEEASVNQFFHILGSVIQQKGLTCVEDGEYEYTLYSSCCNTDKGIYYYTTYENSRISAVDLRRCDLEGQTVCTFPLVTDWQVRYQN